MVSLDKWGVGFLCSASRDSGTRPTRNLLFNNKLKVILELGVTILSL